jgi:hypothetical protein
MLALVTLVSLGLGCATTFSPEVIRAEIARQTGADPARAFELNLGPATLALTRQIVGPRADGSLPLAGLRRFELALYDVPATGATLDFTRMAVRGWEPTVRAATAAGSTLVLVRSAGDDIADLVLVAADGDKALYTRLAGRLSPELPEALGRAVASDGTIALSRELISLTGAPRSGPGL